MLQLALKEIGHHSSSDGTDYATTYRVTGLPVGNDCIIGLAAEQGRWKITWDMDGVPVPAPTGMYETPQLALQDLQQSIESS